VREPWKASPEALQPGFLVTRRNAAGETQRIPDGEAPESVGANRTYGRKCRLALRGRTAHRGVSARRPAVLRVETP